MLRLVTLLGLAACGRVGFEASELEIPDVPAGHDEDGDGVADVDDNCPHLAGAQTDGDGDGVGDLCDPNPMTPGDVIALFATMQPGDQPFLTNPQDPSASYVQLADALRFDGDLGTDGNLFGNMQFPMTLGNARVALGIDVLEVVAGSVANQNQIALLVWDQSPNYFVELNQIPGSFDNAEVTLFDGSNFFQTNASDLATGIHTGDLFMQTTQRVGQGVRFEASWPGEPYVAEVMDDLYQGAVRVELTTNNMKFEIRYVVVITSP
jgi:hypothetical protein